MIGVTSFSKEGYEKYGQNFLKSAHNFPGKIICYTESPLGITSGQVEERNLFQIPGVSNFLENIDQPKFKGMTEHGYNYNFDVWKFCRKMFAQFDAFDDGGQIFWLDGDTEFVKPVSEEYLSKLFLGQHLIVFGREGFYSETGFVGFDTDHPEFPKFKERYIRSLQNGVFVTLPGWHDCYCLDWAREGKGRDLTKGWKRGDSLHVIPKSDLGKYLIHRKGNRKEQLN